MMHSYITFFFFIVFEHWEICYPSESQFVFVDKIHTTTHFKTKFAQSFGYYSRFVGNHEYQIARFCLHFFTDSTNRIFTQEFHDLGFDSAVFVEACPCKTFSAVLTNIVYEVIKFTTRNTCVARYYNTFNHAAVVDNGTEYFKFSSANQICYVGEFHTETKVRFIGTVFIHGFVPSNTSHRNLNINVHSRFKYVFNQTFQGFQNLFLINEAHFQVELSKFRLTVGTQVFITETTNDLEVFFITGYHQDLFKNLWRLWQCIEGTRVNTGWY